MRFFFLFLCFLAMPCLVMAQFGAGSNVTRTIKNTELLVVLSPEYGDAYNEALEAAVTKYWTYTKFRFISGPQYKQFCKDKKYSFLMMFEVKEASLSEEKFSNLGIVQGGSCKKDIQDFAAYANLFTWEDKGMKVECIRAVQIIQNYLIMADANEISNFKNFEEIVKAHNKNRADIKGKIWKVVQEDFLEEMQDVRKIRKIYTDSIKIVQFDAIDDATLKQAENIIYHQLFYDYEGYRYHAFFQAKGTRLLYLKQAQRKERVLIGKETLKALAE
jgi:hypothetical protein